MISIFIATSGRAEMFANMLGSLYETTQGHEIEVVAVIDADYQAYEYAYKYCVNVVDCSRTRRGALWAWNRGLQLSSGNIIVPAGDDQVFHPDWLDCALESFNKELGGYGVLGMNDGAYDGNTQVATMWMFDRAYCKEQMGGIFAPPVYKYFCIDLEWNEKAKMLNRFYWEERSVVEHLHSAHGKRLVDDTDKLKDESWMEEDNKTFEERKAQGFPVTWTQLI